MNILVTGACGQLGNEMRIVSAQSRSDRYLFADIVESEGVSRLDITDEAAVSAFCDDRDIDAIVNCAAYTNVDKAESDETTAEILNAAAPGILARAMARRGGLLVHISTDYVFGGASFNTPIAEDAPENPTGAYGRTKLHGEKAVREALQNHIIIRTAWLYSEFGKNFVKTMLSLTSSKPELKVVFDQAGTPTYALDLAKTVFGILEGRKFVPGTYHFSNEGVCSWYDFTKAIAGLSGHCGCEVKPCRSSEFPSPVKRPAYSVLDKKKIRETFGVAVPYWTDSLRECLGNMGELKK